MHTRGAHLRRVGLTHRGVVVASAVAVAADAVAVAVVVVAGVVAADAGVGCGVAQSVQARGPARENERLSESVYLEHLEHFAGA